MQTIRCMPLAAAIFSGSSSISMTLFSSSSNFKSKERVSVGSLFNVILGETALRNCFTSSSLFSRVEAAQEMTSRAKMR